MLGLLRDQRAEEILAEHRPALDAKGFRFGVLTGELSVRPGDFPMAGVQVTDLIPHSFLRLRIRPQPSAVRDQVGYVVVQLGHRLVERGEPGTAGPGELGQVSACDLTVADDPLNGNVRVPGIVGPEFVPRVAGSPVENCLRGGGRLAFADEQAHEAALGNWAGREAPADADEPVLSSHMVNMIIDEQGDEHVRVEQDGH